MAAFEFDATQVDPSQGSKQFPIGRHKVVIIGDETKATQNDPNSGMLVLHMECVEGEVRGSRGDYNLNLYHATSEDARRIAFQQLSAICHVLGIYKITDTTQLHNKQFYIDVRQQKGSDKYTEIAAVYDSNGNPPTKGGQPQSQPTQQQAPQPSATGPQSVAPAPGSFAPSAAPQPQHASTAAPPWNPPIGGQTTAAPAPPWANK